MARMSSELELLPKNFISFLSTFVLLTFGQPGYAGNVDMNLGDKTTGGLWRKFVVNIGLFFSF